MKCLQTLVAFIYPKPQKILSSFSNISKSILLKLNVSPLVFILVALDREPLLAKHTLERFVTAVWPLMHTQILSVCENFSALLALIQPYQVLPQMIHLYVLHQSVLTGVSFIAKGVGTREILGAFVLFVDWRVVCWEYSHGLLFWHALHLLKESVRDILSVFMNRFNYYSL